MDLIVYPQEKEIVIPSLEKEENKALALLEEKKSYYPFGCDVVFNLDVFNCFQAPASYVYRRLNIDWVKIFTHEMIEKTKINDILAIVMPNNPKSELPLQAFTKAYISTTKYWTISYQHSISVAKRLQKFELNKVTPQLLQ